MSRAFGLALVLPLLVSACDDEPAAPLGEDELPPALSTQSVPGPEWALVERALFSFQLPPGFSDAGLQVSRTSGRYLRQRDGSTLFFDLGPVRTGLRPPRDATGVRQAWSNIGGRRVHLALWTVDGVSVIRGWWPRVIERDGTMWGLLVGGSFTADIGRNHLLAAIRSVTFR